MVAPSASSLKADRVLTIAEVDDVVTLRRKNVVVAIEGNKEVSSGRTNECVRESVP